MYYDELAKTVDRIKNTKEGIDHMCKIMEDLMEEAAMKERAEGRVEGRAEGMELTFEVMDRLSNGESREQIIRELSVSPEFVEKAAQRVKSLK
jgi:predicted transposase YdaD